MAAKLFVGSLAWATTEESLRALFETVGTVVSASVIFDKFSGKSKGFGFVEMGSEDEAKTAMEKLNSAELDGRNIVVSEAKPQAPRENRGFNGGNRNGGFSRDRRN